MFSDTFYPTPPDVARDMLRDVKIDWGELVLDPSAGKGDLLDYIKENHSTRYYRNDYHNLYACEIVPELRAILEDKGYPVLADDFLTYKPTMYFTTIVMNPPFDQAEDHIFHAFEILGHGKVVSLVPSSSLEGKTAKERLLLNMIEQYGSVKSIGQAFRYAERRTDEEISVIVLEKQEDPFNLDFEPANDREHTFNLEPEIEKDLALPGFIPGMVAKYNAAFAAFEGYLKARKNIEKHLAGVFRDGSEDKDPLTAIDSGTAQERYNKFTIRMNVLAWEKVLDHPNFQAILTDRARKMVEKFRVRQRFLDFNIENVLRMFEQIQYMAPDLLAAAIDDAFDEMTKYHEYNREHIEGWKTDLAWKVGPKVILPWCMDQYFSDRHRIRINYSKKDKLDDIDRAMCTIAQVPFSEITRIVTAIEEAKPGQLVESTFFQLRGYMKGTLHMKFKDKALLDKFNYLAAKNKGWLPDGSQTRFTL